VSDIKVFEAGEENKDLVSILCSICSFLLLPFAIAIRGWAIALMWGWYVVPFGLMHLSWVHAFGLSMFVALLCVRQNSSEEKSPEDELLKFFANNIVATPLVVGVGYVVSWWM
jgi:hypothetical protein